MTNRPNTNVEDEELYKKVIVIVQSLSLNVQAATDNDALDHVEKYEALAAKDLTQLIAARERKAIEELPKINYQFEYLGGDSYGIYPIATAVVLRKDEIAKYVNNLRLLPTTINTRDMNTKWQFAHYIQSNPDQRFFQALTNFTGYPFIGKADTASGDGFSDLFYIEADKDLSELTSTKDNNGKI